MVPATTDGPLKPPLEKLVLIAPVKLTKVGRTTVVSDDTWLLGARRKTLTTSLPQPKSTTPMMREPGSSVSVSAALDSLIAVPPVPMMVPELVIVLPLVASVARMPTVPADGAHVDNIGDPGARRRAPRPR